MNSSSSDQEDQDPFNKKYLKIQKLAEGTYGVVWKCRNVETGQLVAMKIFKNIGHEGLPVSAVREIHIIKNIKSQYILRPIQLNIKTKSVCMITEWKQLTLNKLIKSNTPYNTQAIFRQIVKGMDSIHSNFIMHRDLKPANVVLDNGNAGNLKIIDFGMAKEIKWNKNAALTNQVGTLYYRAPQLLGGTTYYSKQIDIWALGCIFYELLTRQILFKGETQAGQLIMIYQSICTQEEAQDFLKNHLNQIEKIKRNQWAKISESLQKVTSGEKELDLLKKFLKINPKQRITCKQALTHQYFSE